MKRLKNLIVCMLVVVMAVVFTLPVTSVEAEAASAPKKTKVTSFKSPSAGKAAVTYAKVKGAKYQIQVATNSKMSKGKKSYKTSATTKVMSLKKGKKYWVRVRTYKKINGKTKYSKWSAKKTVTVRKVGSAASAHVHSYVTPVTEKRTVMTQRPFSEAQTQWQWSGYAGTKYKCMCAECVKYNIDYASTSDVNKNKAALLEHMNEVNSPGWKEEIYEARNVCKDCGTDITGQEGTHYSADGCVGSYELKPVLVKTVEHKATSTTKTVTVGRKCSCGKIQYN